MIDLNKIYCEDCIVTMAKMVDNSIDAIVTDPPYGISFMGKKWDYDVPNVEIWRECLRVLKPGGHILSFSGTRTYHRMVINIEDAGFEIRDMIAWVYGSGFPKSRNIGKELEQWEGWGTALKPALEPIVMARKPLSEKTIVANVLKWGTGGINIDGCRVPGITTSNPKVRNDTFSGFDKSPQIQTGLNKVKTDGRFPANLIHDGDQLVLDLFPDSKSGAMKKSYKYTNTGFSLGKPTGETKQIHEASEGSAARFFYCAKASKKDREEGLEGLEDKLFAQSNQGLAELKRGNTISGSNTGLNNTKVRKNNHPTVKPTGLMRYLCRLITPVQGLIYDPFAGSGSTGKAALKEGFVFIGSELSEQYTEIGNIRINKQNLNYEKTND